jgi:hypothetical protein
MNREAVTAVKSAQCIDEPHHVRACRERIRPFEEEEMMHSSKWAATFVAGMLLTGCARQATVESAGDVAISSSPTDSRSLPSGTTLDVKLDQEIGTKTSKVGDSFSATVTTAVTATNGTVAVPAGSKVYGKVTGLDNSDRVGEAAAIRIDFERIVVNGTTHPLYAKVTATNLETRGADTRDETIKKAGVGAAAGAGVGGILSGGDLDKILLGGALGAAAGTVISLGMGDVEGVLPAGTNLTLQTTRVVGLR